MTFNSFLKITPMIPSGPVLVEFSPPSATSLPLSKKKQYIYFNEN